MTEQTVGPDRLVGLEIGGKYKIVSLLGEGGMGCVYKGEQKLGNTIRKVAIKTLHEHLSHDPQILARFEREVGTVAGLQHPNTIQVFDFGKMDDGTLYIVMEFVEGKSVAGWLETSGPMEPARVVNILKQVCGSLEEAHGLGIVHRDLKPDNIVLCDKAGQHDWVEVLDFGIAKRSNETDEKEQKLTQQGMVLGTPPYMSPEQFTGRPVDRRSDIYSLAVMAYEMLTGGLPFNGNTAWEWATAHMTAQPRPLETFPISQRIPPAMKAAILRGLEKDPLRRPQTVTEFFNMFSTGAGAPSQDYSLVPGGMATPPPMGQPMQQPQYARGNTQQGTPVPTPVPGYPTPPPGYQTGQVYATPPQGAHTYTPQPFPQMATPPPVQEKKGGGGFAIAVVFLALAVLVVGGVGFAYSQGYIGKSAKPAPTDTAASTATNAVTAATVTPNPTDTGTIESLSVDAGKPSNTSSFVGQPTVHKDAGAVAMNPTTTVTTAPTYTAPTYTTTNMPPTYTAPPTYTTAPTTTIPPGAPAECSAARLFKQQGRDRQAAQLALICMRKGGAPPF
jgi:serine/threonine-protein kinase